MKAKITILFCALILKSFAQTPLYNWVNSNSKINILSTTCDIHSNVYISGYASGNTTLGTTTLIVYDYFIAKISSSNEVIWVKKLQNGLNFSMFTTYYINDNKNIVVDSLGNLYASGYFYNSFILDDISIDDTLSLGDFCIIKLDSIANVEWVKIVGTPDPLSIAPRLQYINDATIIMSGRYLSELNFEQGVSIYNDQLERQGVFMAYYNGLGELYEVKQLEPIVEPYPFAFGYDEESVIENEDGGIYRALSTAAAEFSIDGISYEADSVFYYLYGLDTIFYDTPFAIVPNYGLIKYDADLNVLWHKVIKAGSSIFSICSDNDGGVYFAGNFGRDFITIDGDTLINSNYGGQGTSDGYICRFNQNGEKIWYIKTLETSNEFYSDLRLDLIGNLYCNKYFSSFTSSKGYLQKLTSQGNQLWQKDINTYSSNYFVSNCVDYFGNVFATGYVHAYESATSANFDSIAVEVPSNSPQGFVSKIGNCNLDTPVVSVSSNEICAYENTTLSSGFAYAYLWSNGDTTQSIVVNTAGTYSVFAIDSLGCFAKSLDQEIIVNPQPSVEVTASQNTLTASLSGAEYQWIDCENEFQIIDGETNQSFTTELNGTYAVIVSANGCADTSACYVINVDGLNEVLENNLIQVFPNPANDFLQVKLSANQKLNIQKVLVKNILGQIIFTQNKLESTIDISNFSKGIYNLEVLTDQGIWQGQFVKQ
jgi:hypothetical protein